MQLFCKNEIDLNGCNKRRRRRQKAAKLINVADAGQDKELTARQQ
jgi:hypothetical protein